MGIQETTLLWYFVSPLLAALVGGLIAGFFAIYAGKKAHDYDRRIRDENQRRHMRAILQSIHDEIETLWEVYLDRIGSHLEALASGEAFEFYWQRITFLYRRGGRNIGKPGTRETPNGLDSI